MTKIATLSIVSLHTSTVAYGDESKGPQVELKPGLNTVTQDQLDRLNADKNFQRHAEAGSLKEAVPAEEHHDDKAAPKEDPKRARKEGETEAQYQARMKKAKLEPLPLPVVADDAADKAFVDGYFGMDKEARAAVLPAATENQKLMIETDPRNTAA